MVKLKIIVCFIPALVPRQPNMREPASNTPPGKSIAYLASRER